MEVKLNRTCDFWRDVSRASHSLGHQFLAAFDWTFTNYWTSENVQTRKGGFSKKSPVYTTSAHPNISGLILGPPQNSNPKKIYKKSPPTISWLKIVDLYNREGHFSTCFWHKSWGKFESPPFWPSFGVKNPTQPAPVDQAPQGVGAFHEKSWFLEDGPFTR